MMKKFPLKQWVYAGCAVANLLAGPALADPTNWAGGYIGGHFGYDWGDFSNTPGTAGPDGSFANWMGGGQVGNNWQFNRLVLGVEGDGSAIDNQSRNPTATFDEDWMVTARARAGYSFDRLLPYVTAGLGLTNVNAKAPGMGEKSSVEAGVAAGGGLDYMLDGNATSPGNWFGRIEYLYVNVPNDTYNVGPTMVEGGSDNNIVRVGLNYKF